MQVLTIAGGNLFDIANRYLGDATEWTAIASYNNISDPWLQGITTLTIPDQVNTRGAIIGPA
jgi:nucleoid-associated protein YgaU